MGRKKCGQTSAFGKALINSTVKRRAEGLTNRLGTLHTAEYGGTKLRNPVERSVLEHDELSEFLINAEMNNKNFEAERRTQIFHRDSPNAPLLVNTLGDSSIEPDEEAFQKMQESACLKRIPRRPEWNNDMDVDDLKEAENRSFLAWRKEIADLEEAAAYRGHSLTVTPFEKNLDFWRQLWRTVEKSDLVVQILDARDPLFYYCKDLTEYVAEVATTQGRAKRSLVVLNKADFVGVEARAAWRQHFEEVEGVDVVFFSALRELQEITAIQALQQDDASDDDDESAGAGSDDDTSSDDGETLGASSPRSTATSGASAAGPHAGPNVVVGPESGRDVLDVSELVDAFLALAPVAEEAAHMTVGMVGFPNVGKSTLINALCGCKRVSMSRQPGKTKHVQTIELLPGAMTLCDCPGLVFPSAVSTRAHLVVNGTVPIDHAVRRDFLSPVRLIVARAGLRRLLAHYKCAEVFKGIPRKGRHNQSSASDAGADLDDARAFLLALAIFRKKFLRLNVPDEFYAARTLLKDFTIGRVQHAMVPPGYAPLPDLPEEPEPEAASPLALPAIPEAPAADAAGDAEDLEDLLTFLREHEACDLVAADDCASSFSGRDPTKRQMRMMQKNAGRKEQKARGAAPQLAGALPATSLPGKKQKVSKRMADPYGCHATDF